MADNTVTPVQVAQTGAQAAAPQEKPIVSDEVSVITEGTIINGDVISNGSLDIRGQVDGNVSCNGKLTVTGVVNGNSNTSEFFADSAQVEGEVVSSGTVKIGLGSVIIGNVTSRVTSMCRDRLLWILPQWLWVTSSPVLFRSTTALLLRDSAPSAMQMWMFRACSMPRKETKHHEESSVKVKW